MRIIGAKTWKAQEASRAAVTPPERSLALAVEQAAESIVITDVNGNIEYVNPAFTRVTGYRADEALGRNPRILKSGLQNPAYYEELWSTITSGCIWRGELINQRKNGTTYTEEMTIAPVRDETGQLIRFIAIKQDITARRRAEADQRFLASIVEASEDAIIGATPDGLTIFWNRAAEALFGYRFEEVCGRPGAILVAPESLKQYGEVFRSLCEGRASRQFDATAMSKSGVHVPVSITLSPIRDDAGNITAGAAVVRDMTARKRDEQARRESEALFRTAFEEAPMGMCLSRSNALLLRANAAFCRMLGYTEDELRSLGIAAISHPEDVHITYQALSRLVATGERSVQYEKRYIHKNGSIVWARISVSQVEDSGSHAFQFITHVEDITERKHARELLQRSEEKYRRLAANLPDVTWTFDAQGRPVYISPNVEAVLGYSENEILRGGRNLCLDSVHPGEVQRVREGFRALFDENRPFDEEYRIQHCDGRWIWVRVRATHCYEVGGVRFSDGILTDITEAKCAQERLEASLREKDALLREIHHRVKNNLQIVCSLLKLNSRNLRDEEAKTVFADMQNRVKSMALVHETLYRSGDLAGIRFSEYVPRLTEQLLHAYGLTSRQVRVTTDVDSVVLPIDVAIPCALILTELISNSAKYAFLPVCSGGLRVVFRRMTAFEWLLEVEDSGGSPTAEPVAGKSTSFGLELVRLLTEQLGGTFTMDRTSGFRTSVVFPATDHTPPGVRSGEEARVR